MHFLQIEMLHWLQIIRHQVHLQRHLSHSSDLTPKTVSGTQESQKLLAKAVKMEEWAMKWAMGITSLLELWCTCSNGRQIRNLGTQDVYLADRPAQAQLARPNSLCARL